MSAVLRIHLVRHPRPAGGEGICYGRSDLALAEPAEVAARRLRPHLPANARLVSSPLRRCAELAEVLANELASPPADPAGSPLRFDSRLQEIHFGDWEGRRWDDIPRPHLDAWAAAPFDHTPPGGESAMAMAARVIAFAAELAPAPGSAGASAPGDWVLVAHQGPLRVLLTHWLGLPRECWLDWQFDFAAASCLELSPAGARLLWHNR